MNPFRKFKGSVEKLETKSPSWKIIVMGISLLTWFFSYTFISRWMQYHPGICFDTVVAVSTSPVASCSHKNHTMSLEMLNQNRYDTIAKCTCKK